MYADARKIHLIEAIIKTDDESVLAAIEKNLQDAAHSDVTSKKSWSDLSGSINPEEANEWKKAIEDGCEHIDEDEWK